MTEYIVNVPDEEAEYFIARFGLEGTTLMGYHLTGEIVRCRDCTYGTDFFHHDDERWQCANPYQDGDDVKPDAYCWRGKRKDSGDGE